MTLKLEGVCPLLQVFDMPTSIAFYRDALGFEVLASAPEGTDACNWAWLRHGSAELMLNTRYEADDRPAAPDPARVAAHDDTALSVAGTWTARTATFARRGSRSKRRRSRPTA